MDVQRTLALIAHDRKKDEMVAWARDNRNLLRHFRLIGTRSTGTLLRDEVGLDVELLASGPLGGDIQIGGQVVEGRVAGVIFLADPLDKHPHDPDIQALLRLCNVHNVPLATNLATASLLTRGAGLGR